MKFTYLPVFITAACAQYDYIIVGAGTSGLALANRLSQNDESTIALIDPGANEQDNALVKDTLQWLKVAETYINWNYSSIPQKQTDGRILSYSAGKGIGGTSLMNGGHFP